MSFEQDIKDLYKRYNKAIKVYYNGRGLIFKMHFKRSAYDFLFEADTAFKTCLVPSFRDKNIDKLIQINKPKAIEKLQARARGCAYTVSVLDYISTLDISNGSQQHAIDIIADVRRRLVEQTKQSIYKADELSVETGHDKFNMKEFEFLS